MFPVTDASGRVIGYMASGVGFISLRQAHQRGFDVEKLRASLYGGCEPEMSPPGFKQEFPICGPSTVPHLAHSRAPSN